MDQREIYFSELDFSRLSELANTYDFDSLYDKGRNCAMLSIKLAEGVVLPLDNVPYDLVTMNSMLYLRNAEYGQKLVFELVFPEDADLTKNKMSVLSPMGISLIGEKTKRIIRYDDMGEIKRLKIEKILYQPEADQKFRELIKKAYSVRKDKVDKETVFNTIERSNHAK